MPYLQHRNESAEVSSASPAVIEEVLPAVSDAGSEVASDAGDLSGEETEMYCDVWRALGFDRDSSRSVVKAGEIRFLELIVKDIVQ